VSTDINAHLVRLDGERIPDLTCTTTLCTGTRQITATTAGTVTHALTAVRADGSLLPVITLDVIVTD
jgi:ABC-type transport system involved in cytochrome c biogenesis permease component